MPLGPTGREVKRDMEKRYGPDKGARVFFAKENKDPKFARAMKRGAKGRKMSRGR